MILSNQAGRLLRRRLPAPARRCPARHYRRRRRHLGLPRQRFWCCLAHPPHPQPPVASLPRRALQPAYQHRRRPGQGPRGSGVRGLAGVGGGLQGAGGAERVAPAVCRGRHRGRRGARVERAAADAGRCSEKCEGLDGFTHS